MNQRSGVLAGSSALPGGGVLRRVVVVDESSLIHEALRVVLHRSGSFLLAGTAFQVSEGAQQIARHRPDLVVCDSDVRGLSGLDLCRWTRWNVPATRVVMLSARNDVVLARAALDAGVSGYLLKTLPAHDLVDRLRDVMGGLVVLDERLGRGTGVRAAGESDYGLSARECQVLAAMSAGLDNQMIAARLHITHETVKSHVKAILRKLGARDRTHAVAIRLGIADHG